MKQKVILIIMAIILTTAMQAQQNQGFNYKALITNNNNALSNQSISIKFTLLKNGTTSVYQETHTTTTDSNGIVSIAVGEGNPISGSFTNINWGADLYFLKVEINTGNGYQNFGTSEFKAVPFAKYANEAGNVFSGNFNDLNNVPAGLANGDDVNDADHDPTNEIQVLTKNGNVVGLSNGGGDFIDEVNDADHDPQNELQTLSVNGTQLTISDGNTVTLPTGSGGDQWGNQVVQSNNSLNGNGTSSSPLGVNTSSSVFNNWDKNANDDVQMINDLSDAKSDNDGSNNGSSIFIGVNAGNSDDHSDNKNVGFGYYTLASNTTGHDNVAMGSEALKFNTNGIKNVAVGAGSLAYATSGNNNTAIGFATMVNTTNGINNVALGSLALYTNTTGSGSVAIGRGSLQNSTVSGAVAVGDLAMNANTTGADNTAVGNSALKSNTTGKQNIAIGTSTLYLNNADNNIAIGFQSGLSNTTGTKNTATGTQALFSNVTGNENTAYGYQALKANTQGLANTAVGAYALTNTTGTYNVGIGDDAYYVTSNLDNTVALGYYAGTGSSDNRVSIGNASMTWIGGQVTWSTYSDGRIKNNINNDVVGLEFIKKLRPVTYNLDVHKEYKMLEAKGKRPSKNWDTKYDIEKIKMTGFIAQEVEQAAQQSGYDFSGVQKDGNNGLYSLSYAQFVVPLVKAVQEQQTIIEKQQLQIDRLIKENNKLKNLEARVNAMESKMK